MSFKREDYCSTRRYKRSRKLKNFGNTCFVNAAVQCLASCPELVEGLLVNHLTLDLSKELATFNERLLGLLLALNRNSAVSEGFLEAFLASGIGGEIDLREQQDAHEFLKLLTDKLTAIDAYKANQSQSFSVHSKPTTASLFDSGAVVCFDCQRCGKAGNLYCRNLSELSLSLADFAHKPFVSLADLLEQFLHGEKVFGSHCPHCTLQQFGEALPPDLTDVFAAFAEELPAYELGDCDLLLLQLRKFAAAHSLSARIEPAKRVRVQHIDVVAPAAILVLHINREVIHHGAEIALLRGLYVHSHQHEQTHQHQHTHQKEN